MTKKQKIVTAVWSAVGAVLIALLIVGNVFAASFDQVLGGFFGRIGENASGLGDKTYVNDYKDKDATVEALNAIGAEIVSEGITLIKNDNDALPLSKGNAVSVFGMSSTLWLSIDRVPNSKNAAFANSLESAGLKVNGTLRKFYNTSKHTKWGQGDPKGNGDGAGDWSLDEVPQSEYTEDVKASYASFSDAAIVVLTRGSGEGADLPRNMDRFGGGNKHYLELTTEEEELFKAIEKAGCFKKTIVLLRSAGAFELDFLNKYKIDAVLWVAGTGGDGLKSIAPVILGDTNPSGRLVDTYCYDNFSSPAVQNFGDFRFVDKNNALAGFSYVNYAEGIYVGYKYYETRYEDAVTERENVGSYDYASTVAAPFGYGLSYTNFTWSGFDCTYDAATDNYTVSVNVKNTGAKAGKDVVQIYSQSEYTTYDEQNKVEKAAANLCGYAKTKLLQPGEDETVKIEVPRYYLASYDAYGAGTYILEKGTYHITAATDAHSAVNNFLSAKGFSPASTAMDKAGNEKFVFEFDVEETDSSTYSSGANGKVQNRFDNSSLDDAVYLSRSNWSVMDGHTDNWAGLEKSGLTYATGKKSGVSNTTNAAKEVNIAVPADDILARLKATGWDASGNPKKIDEYEPIVTGAPSELMLADIIGLGYDDEKWEELLNKLTVDEMHNLYRRGAYGTVKTDSINKPITNEKDGPEGCTVAVIAQITLGATYNDELAYRWGKVNGCYALEDKIDGWYAPGGNIHRTPFSGRNYEYVSEDSFLTGSICACIIVGAQEKGLNVMMKHMALNDQESNRDSNGCVATFAKEQAIRETYLRPFEMAVKKGNAYGFMQGMNRIGTTRCRSNYALNVEVVRNEWGFDGVLITDYNVIDTEESLACISGGCDLQLYENNPLAETTSKGVQYMLRESSRHILYFVANSNALNGYTSDTVYHAGVPIYVLLLIAIDLIVVAAIGLGLWLKLYGYKLTNEGCTDERKLKKVKILNIVYYSAVGALVLAAVIIFFAWALPLLRQAFEIS